MLCATSLHMLYPQPACILILTCLLPLTICLLLFACASFALQQEIHFPRFPDTPQKIQNCRNEFDIISPASAKLRNEVKRSKKSVLRTIGFEPMTIWNSHMKNWNQTCYHYTKPSVLDAKSLVLIHKVR